MKRAFSCLMLAIGMCFGFALPTPAAEPIKLMVGGIEKIIYLPVKLAEQLGYFSDEGIDVELRSEGAGVQGVDELLVGSVQGVVGFYDHTLYMQANGKAVIAELQSRR